MKLKKSHPARHVAMNPTQEAGRTGGEPWGRKQTAFFPLVPFLPSPVRAKDPTKDEILWGGHTRCGTPS